MSTSIANRKSDHQHFSMRKLYTHHIRWYILIHAINSPQTKFYIGLWYLVIQYSLSDFHNGNNVSPVDLLVYHTFTTLLSFQRTAVMFEDTSVTTSDDPFHFYHILKWNTFHSVCSHHSCCSSSHCDHVSHQSWACKIIAHGNVIIRGLHHRKFAD